MARVPIRTIIETWKACGQNSSEAARQLGIDRRTVQRWVDRGKQPWGYVRWRGVQRRSTAPKRPKQVLWGDAAARVRGWREATGFCREKLAVLAQAQGLEVSASTIHRYLQRTGLVRPSTKRRRPRFQNGQVMRPRNCPGLGYLQMDVKYVTTELSGLPYTCYLYAALDISTRYKVGLVLPKLDEGGALLALYHATQQFPFSDASISSYSSMELCLAGQMVALAPVASMAKSAAVSHSPFCSITPLGAGPATGLTRLIGLRSDWLDGVLRKCACSGPTTRRSCCSRGVDKELGGFSGPVRRVLPVVSRGKSGSRQVPQGGVDRTGGHIAEYVGDE